MPELTGAVIFDRRDRDSVLVTGPDAATFLHSLCSQDVAGLADGQGAHALLLQPQGKLTADFRVLRVGDELWLDCEAGVGSVLASTLNRFRIRVKAEVIDRSHELGVIEVRGPSSLAAAPGTVPETQHAHLPWPSRPSVRIVRADWPDGTPGFDIVGPIGGVDGGLDGALADLVATGLRQASADEHEYRRIVAGVVRQGLDTSDATIPQEAYLERTAVSFTKGCFLGQELVCRIDSFGQVPRLLRLVHLETPGSVEPGSEVVHEGASIGTVTSVATELGGSGAVAIVSVRRTIAVPAAVTIEGVAGRLEVLAGRADDDAPKPVAQARLGLRGKR